jgi:DNA polymerase III epsilon subunit family exonuclease
MKRDFRDVDFVVFDTETTGLSPEEGDRVVEIAAVRIRNFVPSASFNTLVNVPREVSPGAFAVNHISRAMLERAPAPEEVWPGFLNFIRGSCLCSYNAGFDLRFLDWELELLGRDGLCEVAVIDILKMARRLLPGIERYALWFVARNLGVTTLQQHRALSDVEITIDVFARLSEKLKEKKILELGNIVGLFGITPKVLEDLEQQKIIKIQEAVDLGLDLEIRYIASSSGEVTERIVSPRELRREGGTRYLVGFCHLRGDERSFRIDSILHLDLKKAS